MKKIIIMACATAFFLGLNACKTSQKSENVPVVVPPVAMNTDWVGTYTGVTPCADCSGIQTRVSLNADGTYLLQQSYQDKSDSIFEYKGSLQWNDGNIVTLLDDNSPMYFAVTDNRITQLDTESKPITGELASLYVLTKVNPLLVGKRWTLVELNGQPYEGKIEAFLQLSDSTNQLSGNLGCNSFFGTYELKAGNRIRFSATGSTRKLCLDMSTEDEMKRILEIADNYYVDNNTLILNRARMAPLAKFAVLTR